MINVAVWMVLATATAVEQWSSELQAWDEHRFIECIFCIDYDNLRHISVSGCSSPQPMSCRGNACFMRQHKNPNFFLYTSGCLNLTAASLRALNRSEFRSEQTEKGGGQNPKTLLCEVSRQTNTCLCTNASQCNNMSANAPFSEYQSDSMMKDIEFHEEKQFQVFVPRDSSMSHPYSFRKKNSGHRLQILLTFFLVLAHF